MKGIYFTRDVRRGAMTCIEWRSVWTWLPDALAAILSVVLVVALWGRVLFF